MTPEHKLQQEIKLFCGQHDILCFRTNSGKVPLTDGRWFDTGLPTGFPDLFLLTRKGQCIFVETKIRPRKPTKEQERFLEEMRLRGFHAWVIYTIEEFIAQIGCVTNVKSMV
jgi:hypothetical protein